MSMRPFWQPDQYSGHAGQSSRRPLLTQTYTIFLIIFAPPCLISHPPIACPFDGMLLAVPILGMILGNAISAIGIAMNFVQREFIENRDKVETYLAFGASRFEACKPVAVEALKLAILPVVNQLRSVLSCQTREG